MIQKDALELLFQSINPEPKDDVEVLGRRYLYDRRGFQEIQPLEAAAVQLDLGTVADVGLAVLALSPGAPSAIIKVDAMGIRADLNILHPRNNGGRVTMCYWKGDHPPEGRLSYEGLLEYLDQQTGHIADEENLRSALSVLKVVDTKKIVLKDRGASTVVSLEEERGVESGQAELPKILELDLRAGDPSMLSRWHKFRLAVEIAGNAPAFRLVHIQRDGTVDSWIDEAIEALVGILDPSWRIYRGPFG